VRWLDARRGRSGSVHAPTVLDNFAQPHGLLAPHIMEFDAELRLRRPPHERPFDLDRRSILGDVDRERQPPARLERRRAFHRTSLQGEVDDSTLPPPRFAREGSQKTGSESLVFAAVGQRGVALPPQTPGQETLVAQLASEGTVEESDSKVLPETVPADPASGRPQTSWTSRRAHHQRILQSLSNKRVQDARPSPPLGFPARFP
jgi:hypothetical protein